MADVELLGLSRTCELEKVLSLERIDHDRQLIEFARKYVQAQARVMHEELGDEIIEDDSTIIQIRDEVGLDSTDNRVRMVGLATIRCLQKRYLGDCSLTKCKGRDIVDEMVRQVSS